MRIRPPGLATDQAAHTSGCADPTCIKGGGRWEVVERLAAPAPSDATEVDLQRYRALQAPWTDWAHVATHGRHWARVIARVVLEANA